MTITVKIVADSMSPKNDRITTIEVIYPYIVHAQVMTHRVFSRNAQSNRAIPTKRLIKMIKDRPYNPVFRANKPGMVAGNKISQFLPSLVWSFARSQAIFAARSMSWIGVHKETVNRLLLPFMHITVLITSTEWDNFFELRIHDDAQPEIQELATKIKEAMDSNAPRRLAAGEWHLPYVNEAYLPLDERIKVSVARCARVSYLNHDKTNPQILRDLDLYDDLITSTPIHGSPAEHQATPIVDHDGANLWNNEGVAYSNNFRGWKQYRSIL
jgi:thymidylate synthase ThyX